MPDASPPHSLDAERAVIGSGLLDETTIDRVAGIVHTEDFYSPAHAVIWTAMRALRGRDVPLDIGTLAHELRRMDRLNAIGGAQYLGDLSDEIATSAHVEEHARIVADMAALRRLVTLADDITRGAANGESSATVIAHARGRLDELSRGIERRRARSLNDVVLDVFNRIEQRAEPDKSGGVVPLLADYGAIITAYYPRKLYVLGGRPGMGKSAWMLNETIAAARRNVSVLVFSLEMPDTDLGERALAAESGVDGERLRDTRLLTQDDFNAIVPAAETLNTAPVWIIDDALLTVDEIRAHALEHKTRHGLGLIVVDYLQLCEADVRRNSMSREREVTLVAEALKRLAKDLDVPVLALAQLNRDLEKRTDKRPLLADLREAGGIEQAADVVTFLYRDEVYNRGGDDVGLCEVIVAKHRGGSTGDCVAVFDRVHTQFLDAEQATSEAWRERRAADMRGSKTVVAFHKSRRRS